MSRTKHRVRLMNSDDLSLVLEWRNDPKIRYSMYSQELISEEEHTHWFENAVKDTDRSLLIYEYEGKPSGFVNFREFGDDRREAMWGFYLSPFCRLKLGRSMGLTALTFAFLEKSYLRVWGEVLKQNIKSRQYHEKLGFTFLNEKTIKINDVTFKGVGQYVLAKEHFMTTIRTEENDYAD